jgi:hypothetical protein
MQRHRQIAAAPERAASETWDVISGLIVTTLERSPDIAGSDVAEVMELAAPVGRMLIAGGHLDRHPLTLVASPVHLSITTVSGSAATVMEENLDPVPGGASAEEWMVHLPTPDPMGDLVRRTAAGSTHLSADVPPTSVVAESELAVSASAIDLDALARRERGR